MLLFYYLKKYQFLNVFNALINDKKFEHILLNDLIFFFLSHIQSVILSQYLFIKECQGIVIDLKFNHIYNKSVLFHDSVKVKVTALGLNISDG